MYKILITSLGSNTAISVIKGFKKLNNDIFLVGTDTNEKKLCAGYRFVDKFYQVSSSMNELDYINDMKKIIEQEKIDAIIPIHDLEVQTLAKYKKELQPVEIVANDYEIVELCNNKIETNKVVLQTSVNVPKTYDSYDDIADEEYPLIIKPKDGVGSKNIEIFKSKQELEFFLKDEKFENYILQQFIEGVEYTVDCYSSLLRGDFIGGVPRERIVVRDGICTKGRTFFDEELIESCEKILAQLNFKGPSNIQFMRSYHDNQLYFIEINPRFASTAVISIEANFNLSQYIFKELMGQKVERVPYQDINYNLYMSRYWEESFYSEEV